MWGSPDYTGLQDSTSLGLTISMKANGLPPLTQNGAFLMESAARKFTFP